jgi:hypothetical protein
MFQGVGMDHFSGKAKGLIGFVGLLAVFILAYGYDAYAEISSVGAKGPDGSAFVNPLSPNQDGMNDFLNITFVSSSSGHHDYVIVIDTNRDGNPDPVLDWGSQSGKDWTWRGSIPTSSPAYVQWEGKDSSWRTVPNGSYQVWIIEDYNSNTSGWDGFSTWSTHPEYYTVLNNSLSITVSTLAISGTITNQTGGAPIANVHVNAGGSNGWGEGYTDGSGNYTIYGLKAGTYSINAEKDGYFYSPGSSSNVTLSTSSATFNLAMQPAVTVPVQVSLPAAFSPANAGSPSLWLNADARCTNGPGWAHGNGQIAYNASTGTVNLNLQDLATGQAWSVRVTGQFSYWYDPDGPGVLPGQQYQFTYTGSVTFTKATFDQDGFVALTLTKANSVSGSVHLPTAATSNLNINVRLSDESNPANEAWGWGNVSAGQTNGSYNLPAVSNGTYTCYIQVDGYKTFTIGHVTMNSADVALDTATLDAGAIIQGTLHVGGTVSSPTMLWLNANSPSDTTCHGVQISIPAGTDQDIAFAISGLESSTLYQLWCWIEGREFTVNGNKPWQERISSGTSGVLASLSTFQGSITGTVSAPSGVTKTNVVVSATPLWSGQSSQPSFGQADASGSYQIQGLGTGEYLVVANEYNSPAAFIAGTSNGTTGNAALYSSVVFVKNDGAHPTGLNIGLDTPYSVSGTVTLAETVDGLAHVKAMAIPVKLAMMGGDIRGGRIDSSVNMGNGSYSLKLGSGTYVITLRGTDGSNPANEVKFACNQVVKVVNGNTSGVDFTVSNGYSAAITLNFPGALTQTVGDLNYGNFIGGMELYKGEQRIGSTKQVMFPMMGGTPEGDPVIISDPSSSATVTFTNLLPGEYSARFYSPRFIMGTKSFTITDSNVSTSIALATGATITGKVVDATTGSPLTSGVTVSCNSIPWVDGSSKSTEWDPMGAFDADSKKFNLRNLPGGTYLLKMVYYADSTSNVNYASTSIYGITIPSGSTSEFDVGTIKLRQGTTITGTVTDGSTPLPNIPILARGMDSKYGKVELEAKTDVDGSFTLSGIDPDIPYWEVRAAERPWAGDMMRQPCGYGEEVKYNVQPGATSVNFTLAEASESLHGTITIPGGYTFGMPFKMGDVEVPACDILLQRKGQVYADPMDGIEFFSDPSDGTETAFTISDIVPGTYRIMVLNNGLSTYVDEITIPMGSLDISLVEGATVSGTITKPDGSHPTTNDIQMVVALNPLTQELVFGSLTTDPATDEVLSYTIRGLKEGVEYKIALVQDGDDGPGNIFVQGTGVTAADADETLTLDAVMEESAPTFMISASKSGNEVMVGLFSTTHLRDEDASSIFSTTGTGTVSNAVLSPDKTQLSFIYTPATGETEAAFTITAHYGADYTQIQQTFAVNLAVLAANEGLVNSFMGGKVNLGGGNASGVYFEPGTIQDNGDGQTVVKVTSSEVGAGGEEFAFLSVENIMGYKASLGLFGIEAEDVIAPEASSPLPSWATARSNEYNFTIGSDAITEGNTVTVILQYDEGADTSRLNVLHYVDGQWVVEDTNKTIDTVNRTITVEVTSLSPFVAAEGTPPDEQQASGGGGGGGSCFMETARPGELSTLILLLISLAPVLLRAKRS